MNTLIVGDHFIGPEAFQEAVARVLGPDFGPVRTVRWAGADAAEQVMEKDGPEAVPTPDEVVEAAGEAEVLLVHFAPVPKAVLEAAPRLKAVVVAPGRVRERECRGGHPAGRGGRQRARPQRRRGRRADPRPAARRAPRHRKGRRRHQGGRLARGVGRPGPRAGRQDGRDDRHVARQLARRLSGFRVRLLVHDPYVDPHTIDALGGEKVADLDGVFREADAVTLHARLTDETRRFIGRRQFALMKPTAYFVNTARSRMVDEDALYEALRERRIAGAALDVHDGEPLPPDSPWRALGNVTLTPHVAGSTEEAWRKSVDLVAEALRELHATGRAANTVNPGAGER